VLRAVEQEFKLSIPNLALAEIKTMGDIKRFVEQIKRDGKQAKKLFNLPPLPPNLFVEQ
jgi:hypothetical protein